MLELGLKNYAHVGDAVYELFVREKIIFLTSNSNKLHKLTTSFVCAPYQASLLDFLHDNLTEDEKELARRARNLPLTRCKQSNQAAHRHATAFETLIGYWYAHDKDRYEEIVKLISSHMDDCLKEAN